MTTLTRSGAKIIGQYLQSTYFLYRDYQKFRMKHRENENTKILITRKKIVQRMIYFNNEELRMFTY